MNIYYKLLGGHYHFRVFMNGAKCGDLCCRQEEFREFQAAFAHSVSWIEEPGDSGTKPEARRMWVIMGNDYPDGVCSTAEKAEAVVARNKGREQDRLLKEGQTHGLSRVYWRAYDFEVDGQIED